MKRPQLEHVIRAACAVANVTEIVVIGSQSILGQYPNAPEVLLQSQDADVFPKDPSIDSILIDGAIGEKSIFHETFGYYAHGVGAERATLPQGTWQRLIPVCNENTSQCVGWCLEAHDLAISKLAAGREKDQDYVIALHQYRMIHPSTMLERLNQLSAGVEQELLRERWQRIAKMK